MTTTARVTTPAAAGRVNSTSESTRTEAGPGSCSGAFSCDSLAGVMETPLLLQR